MRAWRLIPLSFEISPDQVRHDYLVKPGHKRWVYFGGAAPTLISGSRRTLGERLGLRTAPDSILTEKSIHLRKKRNMGSRPFNPLLVYNFLLRYRREPNCEKSRRSLCYTANQRSADRPAVVSQPDWAMPWVLRC